MDKGCARTIPEVQSLTFPWNNSWFPHHPRSSWAGETSFGLCTCRRPREACPGVFRPLCNEPWATKPGALDDCAVKNYCSPESCTIPWSYLGERLRRPSLSTRSHSCGDARRRAGTIESGPASQCCRLAEGPRTRTRPAPGWSQRTGASTGSCRSRLSPCPRLRTRSARVTWTRQPCCTPLPRNSVLESWL